MDISEVARADIDGVLSRVQADDMGIDPDVGTWLAARDEHSAVIGVARLTEIDGVRTIDDIWVVPEFRRRGIARALIERAVAPVWLICDEDMISFYERRGFHLVSPEEFPDPLAVLYAERGEWPRAADHLHFAMLLT